ncbi:MAG: hypothetical protein EBV03_08515 [Proteobacteria bacterium]|nr:hypothetical protein [Pseudomonadota bacterium]
MRFVTVIALCLFSTACAQETAVAPANADAVRKKLAGLPQGQHYLAVQGGWVVEHRCNLLPPAEREQLWVDKMQLRQALSRQTLTQAELQTLDNMAESTGGADAYPCDAPKSRALIDAAAAVGATERQLAK